MERKETFKQLLKLALLLALLYVVFKYFLLPLITSPQFQQFTESIGILGYLVIIGYVILSHVFAPVAGTPGVALGVTIYGINTGMWLLYIGGLISASINFTISKRFGRRWVIKLVGKDSMSLVDEFSKAEGRKLMILSRLIGFSLFDFISYAAGLTSIKFKDYIIITALFGLIPNLLSQLIFKDIDFQSETGIMIWMGSVGLTGISFAILMRNFLKKKESTKIKR